MGYNVEKPIVMLHLSTDTSQVKTENVSNPSVESNQRVESKGSWPTFTTIVVQTKSAEENNGWPRYEKQVVRCSGM